MAQGTKITFSEAELDVITNTGFFYTKHAAMQKVMDLMSETERAIRGVIASEEKLGLHTKVDSPKIFRGENYRLLPYMMLDYPRLFSASTVFAFRTMFWWGKEFSFTIHLQGEAWEKFKPVIAEKINRLEGEEFYCCVHKSPWQYYFEEDNYIPLDEMLNDKEKMSAMLSGNFIKISRRIGINEFQNVPAFATTTLQLIIKMLF